MKPKTSSKIRDIQRRTDNLVSKCGVDDALGLAISASALSEGEIDCVVSAKIPRYMSPEEAKNLGWALFFLGRYGGELIEAVERDGDLNVRRR